MFVCPDVDRQPFNHPLLIAIKKIAPALAAGNSVIVKPSELAPISVLEFAEMAAAAGGMSRVVTVKSMLILTCSTPWRSFRSTWVW